MKSKLDKLTAAFSAAPQWALSLLKLETAEPSVAGRILIDRFGEEDIFAAATRVIEYAANGRFSILLSAENNCFFGLELAKQMSPDLMSELIAQIATSDSIYIPYDLRSAAFRILGSDPSTRSPELNAKINRVILADAPPIYKDLSQSLSNDIDHNFEIPESRAERNRILLSAARVSMHRARDRLARRALGAPVGDPAAGNAYAPSNLYVPQAANSILIGAAPLESLDWREFIIDWNEVLIETSTEKYTVAELLRLILLDNEYHLPGLKQRAIADAVHLNLLKLSSGATIGLRAGVLFVEHGFRPEGSFFFFGQNAILGKGCVVDATGVVVIEPNAFLGGGLSPILVHTHKHVRGGGSAERMGVAPTGFRARKASRLPMEFVGLLEVMDLEDSRWQGIERIPLAVVSRGEVWNATSRDPPKLAEAQVTFDADGKAVNGP